MKLNLRKLFKEWKLGSILICLLLILRIYKAEAQNIAISADLLKAAWPASWINYPDAPKRDYGVYHFRKEIRLGSVPKSFIVHISADNRYRFFVNGEPVCSGPARGDLFNWFYESVDLSPFLKPGKNVLAAVVWNMGVLAPVGQISNQTAFVVQGNTDLERMADTGADWRVTQNTAYTPCSLNDGEKLNSYVAVGPGDQVDGNKYPWDWEKPDYDDSRWNPAAMIVRPEPVGFGTDNRWTLSPRTIPLFREKQIVRFASLRRSIGVRSDNGFLKGIRPLRIAAHQKVKLLVDQGEDIAAYPELVVSGGKHARITQTYAESLFDSKGLKGNRNEITDKEIIGNEDIFIPDGGVNRKFRPLWFRAYRYLQVNIETGDEELLINDLYSTKTGYPIEMKATFSSNDSSLEEIWKVGWRTQKLCAGEVFYDTPYYEQLQYTGDTRIQALITLYCSGDDRLMRKAILDFYHSRTPEGLTQGRYPSNRLQIIPTFSLFWVSMVHDYWMHRKDDAFVIQFLPAINEIMEWFHQRIDLKTKMLGPLTWWNFVDWSGFGNWGVPDGVTDGNSSIVTLQYACTLKQAADLFQAFGRKNQADEQSKLSKVLAHQTYSLCYNQDKGMLSDTPDQKKYSQHAGIWAILSDAVPPEEQKQMMEKILNDKSISQTTFYYRFYLTRAMKKVGMADRYYQELTPWRDMLKLGLTTFAETPEPSRSDCHAWSASPDYDILATICGIIPAAPGFEKVLIQPALGELKWVKASMPHPNGKITIALKHTSNGGINATVTLPEKISGTFWWKNKNYSLKSGLQKLNLL